ncbi:GAF and ANTAR domain-containing protein [Kribbella sandramycini]|uniref:GAF and ANTAR domain-containing protein n=1 Tax=Kribbella sandramycini TaxID=60450 RepID=A0A7Y4P0Z5_9ACTN|nr:ANTAR domain-containing protein [Kribbella sandramycini]MBB6565361.1 hypothetical protein [Kribbella sandramycini]NOL41630.1 GAF and ANTAR domain-containing protein [Kribbella sandramycini]
MTATPAPGRHDEAAYFADLALRLHRVQQLEELLDTIADAAAEAFDGALPAVATVGSQQQLGAIVGAAADLVRAEAAVPDGPWWDAVQGRTIVEGSALPTLPAGVTTVVHAPVFPGAGRPHGVLSLYLTAETPSRDRLPNFCTYAGIALEGLWYQSRLRRSMNSHTTVGSGIGILMERYNLDRVAAYDVMAQTAIEHGVRLRDVVSHLREDPDRADVS